MNTKSRRLLALIPWTLLPLLVVGYVTVWDRLPARLAIHFDIAGEPNGWMGRGAFLIYATVFLLFELSVFTLVLTTKYRELASPFLLIAFYCVAAGETALVWQVLEYNATGTGIKWTWVAAAAATAAIVPVVAIFTGKHARSSVAD
ncbi:MAG TPA: DUF1648 domain-containing protein [Pyrinomonadaceae bacterium]|nr:DUF1648 domain-containing protein [Pyrinomonadaceae bacterium]